MAAELDPHCEGEDSLLMVAGSPKRLLQTGVTFRGWPVYIELPSGLAKHDKAHVELFEQRIRRAFEALNKELYGVPRTVGLDNART